MATQFRITGLKRWRKALDARGFDKAARRNMRLATALNGKVAERIQRKTIQSSRKIKRNAALTRMIKGDAKPLVDEAALFNSITSKVIDDFTVFSGVLRTSKSYNIGLIVHEGSETKVTKDMRWMFMALWQASVGRLDPSELKGRAKELFEQRPGGWFPLSKGTMVISIPGRPWVEIAFSNTKMVNQVRKNWTLALEATFRERAKG